MAQNREDVWADLRYALDELERPSRNIHSRLTDAADLEPVRHYFWSKGTLIAKPPPWRLRR